MHILSEHTQTHTHTHTEGMRQTDKERQELRRQTECEME